MRWFIIRDIKFFAKDEDDNITVEGDIQIDSETGDFKLTYSEETIEQEILNRLNTNNPDWFRHYNNGADLEDIRGKSNNRSTAEMGKQKIIKSLTHDNFLQQNNVKIKPIPTGSNELTYYIFVNLGYNEPLVVPYVVDI